MSCACHCRATAEHFGPEAARKDLERYHEKGPDATTAALLDGIRSTSRRYARLLDVGGGIGTIHHELLGSSVDRAVHVEASSACIAASREEDERRGHEGRVEYVLGDAADVSDGLESADVVTLDRVICCYPAWERLVQTSASKATKLYAFSIPHDRWYVRLGVWLANFVRSVRGDAFRAFVHPVDEIETVLEELGFHRMLLRRTLVWHVALFSYSTATEAAAAA